MSTAHNELTNLLPINRQRALAHAYILKIATVGMVLIAALIVAAWALSLPTYIYLSNSTNGKEEQLRILDSQLSSEEEKQISARLALLNARAKILVELANTPQVSPIMREVLSVAHPGVTLSNFVYLSATKKAPASLALSGVAATRDTLRSYQLALQGLSFARAVALPVSAYAKDLDIAFTITISIDP